MVNWFKIGLYLALAYVAIVFLLPAIGSLGGEGGSGSIGGGLGATAGYGSGGTDPTIKEIVPMNVGQEGGKGYPQSSFYEAPTAYGSWLASAEGKSVTTTYREAITSEGVIDYKKIPLDTQQKAYESGLDIGNILSPYERAERAGTRKPPTLQQSQESAGGGRNAMVYESARYKTPQSGGYSAKVNQWGESGGGTYTSSSGSPISQAQARSEGRID